MNEEVPPFGAENLPLKEIKEKKPETASGNRFLVPLFLGIIVILIGIIGGLVWTSRQKPAPIPSPSPIVVLPSPSPEATPLATPSANLPERISTLQEKFQTVDLQQAEFAFPQLDFAFK